MPVSITATATEGSPFWMAQVRSASTILMCHWRSKNVSLGVKRLPAWKARTRPLGSA